MVATPGSSVPGARAALYSLLVGLDLPGTEVTFGHPAAYATNRTVSILGVGPGTVSERPAVVNGRVRREDYDIEVAVRVDNPTARTAEDAMAVEAAAFGVWNDIRAAVLVTADLAGTVDTAFPSTVVSDLLTAPVESGGYRTYFLGHIACTAWIT